MRTPIEEKAVGTQWEVREYTTADGANVFNVYRQDSDVRWRVAASGYATKDEAFAYITRQTFVPQLVATHAYVPDGGKVIPFRAEGETL